MTNFINEFVVKVASRCNLNCDYCYEYNLGDESWRLQPKLMSEETLNLLGSRIADHARIHELPEVVIGFHGGEPLLFGPDRLDKACQILRSRIDPFCKLHLGMQTNGTLLNSKFLRVIQRHEIAVSVSVDGDRSANDLHRLNHKGQSSYERVLEGVKLLKKNAPEQFQGVLAVIDLNNDPIATFDAVAGLGAPMIDFLLPHYHWDRRPIRPNGDPRAYGRWCWEVYRAWVGDRHPNVTIRFFSNIVHQLAGGKSIYEAMTLAPIPLVVVATDGTLEAVDCLKSTASGVQVTGLSLQNSTFDDVLGAPIVSERNRGEEQLCEACRMCEFKIECAGGYYPHRWSAENGFNNPSVYCDDLFWLVSEIREDLFKRRKSRAPVFGSASI